MRRALAGLVLVATLLVPFGARADDASQARFHDELAREHYDAGRFRDAIREFFLEHRLAPNPRIVFNIALCFDQLGRTDEAFHWFSTYDASDDDDPARRRLATERLAALRGQVALVLVTSEPAGAEIYIDRRELGSYGVTPRVVPVGAGAHRVYVERADHRGAEVAVEAVMGGEVRAHAVLVPILGTLAVTSSAGGGVRVRNAAGDTLAEGPAPFEARLPPGTYQVEVAADEHEVWRGLAELQEDRVATLAAEPEPLPTAVGELTVTSNVAGAVVEVDGRAAGFTPTMLTLTAEPHRVRVYEGEREPWEGRVNVERRDRGWLTVSLATQGSVTRSPATWAVGGAGAAMLVSGLAVGGRALRLHGRFDAAGPGDDVSSIPGRGDRLNHLADGLVAGGLVGLAVGVALYFLTEDREDVASDATFTRGGGR